MKKLIILFLIVSSCSGPSGREKYVTRNLPHGIILKGFNEKYDKPHGKYELYFFFKNGTGKKIEYPQIDGDCYLKGSRVAILTGGPGKALEPLDSGVVSFGWIMPEGAPDSIIFKHVGL